MLDPKALSEMAARYADVKDFINNEEETKASLVIPLIKLLGYDPYNPREVRREWAAPFTENDGKNYRDKMDLAIFDPTGAHPQFVLEVKTLGTDIGTKSPQLARYIAQVNDLHFGIMTDGCHWQFYGDLENPNQMDPGPFFQFAFDDPNADWNRIGRELKRFSRDDFDADNLVKDAENAKYRQAMIEKLSHVLKKPSEDEQFVRWLSDGIYKGHRTSKVMARLSNIARDAVEPALYKVMSNEFIERLRDRIINGARAEAVEPDPEPVPEPEAPAPRKGVVTTEEELELYEEVKKVCVAAGYPAEDIVWGDTTNYFNVSYQKKRNWFFRYFGDSRRKNVATMVPVEEAQSLCPGYTVEKCPQVFGESRVYIDSVDQVGGLGSLILKALHLNINPAE